MASKFCPLALAGLMTLAGCGKLGALFTPNPRPLIPAQFKLPAGKAALLIDAHMVRLNGAAIKETIAETIIRELQSQRSARKVRFIPYQRLRSVETESPEGKKYSIQHIGRQLKADFVIYVNITQFDLQSDPESPLILPAAQANVKVFDVNAGERLWPIEQGGRAVQVRGRRETETLENANRREWSTKLADMLAVKIAQQFYPHREGE